MANKASAGEGSSAHPKTMIACRTRVEALPTAIWGSCALGGACPADSLAAMQEHNGSDWSVRFAELQADYGPYHFPEMALQRIWRDAHFDRTRLTTADGRQIAVLHPGIWNRLGGPDFRNARLVVGGKEVVGDVEVHVHAADWNAHGHAEDPAYADVLLHIVLFPEASGFTTLGYGGKSIPIAALLDLIPEDLESHAAAYAMETLGARSLAATPDLLLALSPAAREAHVRAAALRRWQRKVSDARVRIARLGWANACHAAALEILGQSRNRVTMHRIAIEWPLDRWRAERPKAAALVASQAGFWSRQGVRPANAPAVRLGQYDAWLEAVPNWPDGLREAKLPLVFSVNRDTWAVEGDESAFRNWLRDGLCGGAIGGRRFDTLVCDGFLPLLAALDRPNLDLVWLAWPAGEIPALVESILAGVVTKPRPDRRVTNGWIQGIWACCLEAAVSPAGDRGGS